MVPVVATVPVFRVVSLISICSRLRSHIRSNILTFPKAVVDAAPVSAMTDTPLSLVSMGMRHLNSFQWTNVN